MVLLSSSLDYISPLSYLWKMIRKHCYNIRVCVACGCFVLKNHLVLTTQQRTNNTTFVLNEVMHHIKLLQLQFSILLVCT